MSENALTTPISQNYGTPPRIEAGSESSLTPTESTEHAINNPSQALAVAYRMKEDWKKGVQNQAAITAQLNGQRPRDPGVLENLGRNWLPNINSGILRVEAGKVPARLWQPINTASFLTAAKLPDNWPMGLKKTGIFRQKVTHAIRSWRKWPWFMRQLAREVGFFGFGFAVHFDEWDWMPTFVRQDRAFVPMGFEILEDELPLFMVQYDYQPFELLTLVKEQLEAKIETGWDKDAVAAAINSSGPRAQDGSPSNRRSYEEMIREASIGWTYEKGYNKIATYHVFSTDADGSVSHHIVLANDLAQYGKAQNPEGNVTVTTDAKFIFEKRGQFEKMSDVVTVMMFDPDDGTVQGSWGAGQMLFDLSIEAEKSINDWMASLKQAAKLKIQAGDGKNPDEVRLDVDDAMMVVSNGTYAGNTAAVTTDPRPFQALIEALGQLAREKIGSYIPPIPLQPTDIKAAQINAKQAEQEEVKQQIFQTWLWQFACLVENIVKRLLKKDSPDETAKKLREDLLKAGITEEELEMLVDQNQIETIFEFTDLARAKRAMFCASKEGNPFYNQKTLQEYQAEAAGGASFMNAVLIPGDDATVEQGARRAQQEEASSMITLRTAVAVLPADLDWYHMLELRPLIERYLMQGIFDVALLMLNHYKAHYIGGVAKQGIPKDRINPEKAFIAKAAKTIETGQIPPDGFADKIDPVEEAQAQMASQSATTRGPTEMEEPPESGTDRAGREALIEDVA
jgi:hypothetical protein